MPDTASADAPGRVNLIGEHTDYHGGYVLPTTIPQRTRVHLARRADRQVIAATLIRDAPADAYEIGRETAGRGWLDYVQGVTATLRRHGVDLPGFDLRIESTIPVGAGVSSSAALEVSLLRGLDALLSLDLDGMAIATLAHEAETQFVGAPVGIMDQMASSLGRDDEALFIDTRALTVTRLPLPASLDLAVIHSGVIHAHAGGDYVERRRESFAAADRLGVASLRDLDAAALPRVAALPPLLARRARHVITENARVLSAVAGLESDDAPRLGRLFAESHASMRDDYEISTPEIEALVRLGAHHQDVYGARLTGGGFGGAVVYITQPGRARTAAHAICAAYNNETGKQGVVLVPPDPTAQDWGAAR